MSIIDEEHEIALAVLRLAYEKVIPLFSSTPNAEQLIQLHFLALQNAVMADMLLRLEAKAVVDSREQIQKDPFEGKTSMEQRAK